MKQSITSLYYILLFSYLINKMLQMDCQPYIS